MDEGKGIWGKCYLQVCRSDEISRCRSLGPTVRFAEGMRSSNKKGWWWWWWYLWYAWCVWICLESTFHSLEPWKSKMVMGKWENLRIWHDEFMIDRHYAEHASEDQEHGSARCTLVVRCIWRAWACSVPIPVADSWTNELPILMLSNHIWPEMWRSAVVRGQGTGDWSLFPWFGLEIIIIKVINTEWDDRGRKRRAFPSAFLHHMSTEVIKVTLTKSN